MKLALLLLLIGCGKEALPPVTPVPPDPIPVPQPSPEKKVVLSVFGAPWCTPCKSALPKIQKELDALPVSERNAIEFRVYIETGPSNTTPPTQQDAERYKASLGLHSAIAIADPWKMQVFRKYHSNLSIPAGVVTKLDGTALRAFPAPVDIQGIVDFAAVQKLGDKK